MCLKTHNGPLPQAELLGWHDQISIPVITLCGSKTKSPLHSLIAGVFSSPFIKRYQTLSVFHRHFVTCDGCAVTLQESHHGCPIKLDPVPPTCAHCSTDCSSQIPILPPAVQRPLFFSQRCQVPPQPAGVDKGLAIHLLRTLPEGQWRRRPGHKSLPDRSRTQEAKC